MIAKRKPAHASHASSHNNAAANGNGSRLNGLDHSPASEIPDQLPTVEQQIAAVRTAINAASAAHILLLTANPTAGTGSAILAVGRALPALAKAIYQLRKHAEEK